MGGEIFKDYIIPLLKHFFDQLKRLPSSPGDDNFGPELYLVNFNKVAYELPVNTRGENPSDITASVGLNFGERSLKGGSCISCGLDLARDALLAGGKKGRRDHLLLSFRFMDPPTFSLARSGNIKINK